MKTFSKSPSLSMDKQLIFKKIKNIMADYLVMECDRCAITLSDWSRKNKISHKIKIKN